MAATITENEVDLSGLDTNDGRMWHICCEDNYRVTLCGRVYKDDQNIEDFYSTDEIECVVCLDIWNRM